MSEARQIGLSGLFARPLAFGGNVFGWTVTEATAFTLLDAFVSEGFSLIDTANVYPYWHTGGNGGESEAIIGNWIRARPGIRNKVLLATKVGFSVTPGSGGLSRKVIFQQIDISLKRLGTDHIDIYQSHVDDPITPIEETLGTYADLIRAGKIRAIGASNFAADRLLDSLNVSRANGFPRYEVMQPLYNLYHRNQFETALKGVCIQNQIGVIPYFSLANGFLTGKYRTKSEFLGSQRGQFVDSAWALTEMFKGRGLSILAALDRASVELNVTCAQLAIAWLVAQGVTAPIASATSIDQLQQLIRGTKLEVPPVVLGILNEVSAFREKSES